VIGIVPDIHDVTYNSITNAWIVFGIVGLFVITIAILVERSLERIKRIAQDWRERLEKWDTSL